MDNIHQSDRHSLARILTHVVDQQQQCVLQFNDISRALESVRAEIRRTDENHHKEVDHLHDIIKQLMQLQLAQQTQNRQPQTPVAVAPQAYNQPVAPTGQPLYSSFEAQQMAMKQQQMQMQWLQHQLQQQQMAAAGMGGLTCGLPQASKPLVPMGQPASPLVQSLAQQQLKAPPTPSSTGTVTLPISSPQKPEVPKAEPKVEVKKEATPVPQTPSFPAATATPTSTINFGGLVNKAPATSTTPAVPSPLIKTSSLFDKPNSIFVKPATTPVIPTKAEEDDDDEDKVEEYEPQVEFQPVIPLPELVDVKTGEEDEIVLFEERCKLYRYAAETKEWKERGIGNVKVLKHPKTGIYRVVMRREQIHKLCANFNLTKDMKISKMGKNTKACAWHCHDFSEEDSSHEQLSAKFGSTEQADQFIKFFNEGVESSSGATPKKEEPKKEEKKTEEKKPESFGSQFIKKADEWDCQGCYTRQPATVATCPCCGTNKDGSAGEKDIFSKPASGSSSFSFGLGQATEKPKFSFGMNKEVEKPVIAAATSTTPKPKFSFADAASAHAQEESPVQVQKAVGFGASATGSKFSFGGASPATAAPATGLFGGANKPTFSFAQKKEDTPSPATTASPSTFSFKPAASSPALAPGKSIFGGSAVSTASPAVEKKDEEEKADTSATNKIFGQGSSNFSFSGFGKGNASIFNDDTKLKAQADLAKQKQSKFGVDKTKKEHEEEDQDDEDEEEYEPEVEFKPVIPLPDLIDVKTGEEDETILFKERCKLYRYVTETKEWKERGTGEIKILKNPETNTQRIVMRREQTHKLCANFNLTKGMSVNKMVKNNKATQWICKDYSEGELAHEQFSAKFGSSELADKFVSLFTEATAQ